MSAPAELAAATSAAESQYGLPSGVLLGIWQREDGAYPNPYVNSAGYGGLFGTSQSQAQSLGFSLTDPNTTQQQANQAASVLRGCLDRNGGSLSAALSCYSGGGYTSVPGVSVSSAPSAPASPIATVQAALPSVSGARTWLLLGLGLVGLAAFGDALS